MKLHAAFIDLLLKSDKKSIRSLITSIWNKSNKSISQKTLWDIVKKGSRGVGELEGILKRVNKQSETRKKVSKNLRGVDKKLSLNELRTIGMSDAKIRQFLASEVMKRLNSMKPQDKRRMSAFFNKLSSNILSQMSGLESYSIDEILSYIHNTSLEEFVDTFKYSTVYYQ